MSKRSVSDKYEVQKFTEPYLVAIYSSRGKGRRKRLKYDIRYRKRTRAVFEYSPT